MRAVYPPGARVLAVTGARGFVGREVIRRLLDDGRFFRILALDVREPGLVHPKLRHVRVDLTLPGVDVALAELLAKEGCDTLLHAAFLSSPSHDVAWAHELEAIGTLHVLTAAGAARLRRVVMWSQTLVYGAAPHNPNFLTEEHPLRDSARASFLADKVEAERQALRFCREHPDTAVVILRTAPMLGPTIQNYLTRLFSHAVCPRLLGFDPLVQLLHEQDAIDAFLLALCNEVRGTFNIVAEGVLPYSTVLARMGRVPLPLPRMLAYPLVRTLWGTQLGPVPPELLDFLRYLCVADGTRARQQLGFSPRFDICSTIDDFVGLLPKETPSASGGKVQEVRP
ncbi:MAG: NAD-dependent epimerase/dehydratase family protein [Myxococcales bacterium]|nr:NAD-dependent epimerase/dehydratase family protein [Myxococcota bacterium]MDW8281949.1 NAD-dependent epimerase/dehydratase family protein [Myxococcales bacterium]